MKRIVWKTCHPELVSGSIDIIEFMDTDPLMVGQNDFYNLCSVDSYLQIGCWISLTDLPKDQNKMISTLWEGWSNFGELLSNALKMILICQSAIWQGCWFNSGSNQITLSYFLCQSLKPIGRILSFRPNCYKCIWWFMRIKTFRLIGAYVIRGVPGQTSPKVVSWSQVFLFMVFILDMKL